MSSRPTLQDIAKKAGVAISTVSRALRSDSQIPPATRERIRHTADALGYRPDPLLAALSMRLRGKSSSADVTTIAYVTNSKRTDANLTEMLPRGYYHNECLTGAMSRAKELGFRLEHFRLNEKGMTSLRLSRILYNRGICGVCIGPLAEPRGHLKINWSDFSCVTIGYSMLRPALHRAATHHFQGVLLALRELRRLGYRRIGVYLDDNTSKRMDHLLLAGALVYKDQYGAATLRQSKGYDESSRPVALAWFRANRLDAVIGPSRLKTWLEDDGIRLPEDAGFVTSNYCQSDGDIAGIDQRTDLVASAAIDLLVAQIQSNEKGIPVHPKIVLMQQEWRPGRTVRQAPRK